ncbi:DUF805 domain-containing protein [Roseateles saccharophilus]|uniref:Uncharacterized membrane protein YhaH (DUF805 family) n=1 Tax=Roseateles saccharophilus TaxID=304 RepID=A0A4R3VBZ9_ROSSA|nr:DUF805 domain-containing protein [Roseateles saccharophilus]MDG0831825.1 DUF805 domain-containing protein [Roseateles saccharophilus]TCV01152.1 uncharacterized membrane protein YhaH (DUF805 family) [Roseateles saccharophilus]
MNFQQAIQTCFSKYVDFSGRASRSEYWWFFLFVVLGCAILWRFSYALYVLFALGTLLPSLAAASRRLHDTGRSGWWQLIGLIPIIGLIVLLVFLAQESGSSTDQGAST